MLSDYCSSTTTTTTVLLLLVVMVVVMIILGKVRLFPKIKLLGRGIVEARLSIGQIPFWSAVQ